MQDFIITGKAVAALFIIAIPVACIAWTITHEEAFAELKNYCVKCKNESKNILKRKFFYLFTCEYCFSHYVTALLLIITKFQLLYTDWKGYFISFFSIVWVANIYMSIYARIRVTLKKEKLEADIIEKEKKNNHS
ncbi:hypothetical protein [Parafilimonas terrae]|jgi:hypothetical protein|uniref:Uncharacterized protein n=1 Tax=Parafilimonas terrae TaxID=1465490 RepID=A0A1I5WKD5_9BACT|nr:hypothetical protein [Parafilimonas terrae]SFQ20169.1 hypothetical protein SAMN05444277_106249 [Parafilimonas terrae]